ncbi:MAG: hypothetical protein KC503_06985 [Myxococcales bacterium]|nr:hypothetical protein [Myxococcales bacterium]
MAECQKCGEEVEELYRVKVGTRRVQMCEDCLELHKEEQAIAAEAEGAMQDMMGYKGR